MDELKSINYQLGKIVGTQEAMGKDIAEIKDSILLQQKNCIKISGGLGGEVDKLKAFNDKLTVKIGVVGIVCGALAIIGKGLIIPVWHYFTGQA